MSAGSSENIEQSQDTSGPPVDAPVPQRTHHMVTRSRDGSLPPQCFTVYRYPVTFHVSTDLQEPSTFSKARKSPQWRAAMLEEFRAFLQNHTWDLVPPTQSQNVIGCKCVYCIK